MCGLPGSGKTTTAGRLRAVAGGVLIRSCDVYQELGISLPEWVRRTRGFTVDVNEYDRVRDEAYRLMARRLEEGLARGASPVILDAVHGEAAKRQVVYEVCRAHGATPVILRCRCDDEAEVRRRFDARRGRESEPEREASDLAVYWDIKRRWQEPAADRARQGVRIAIITYDTVTGAVTVDGATEALAETLRAAVVHAGASPVANPARFLLPCAAQAPGCQGRRCEAAATPSL
jgi:predicted kinase